MKYLNLTELFATGNYQTAARIAARFHGALMQEGINDTMIGLPVPCDPFEPATPFDVTILRSRPQLWQCTIRINAHGISGGAIGAHSVINPRQDPVFRLLDAVADGALTEALGRISIVRIIPQPDGSCTIEPAEPARVPEDQRQ